MKHRFISPEYLAQQKALHAGPKGYGGKGAKWAPQVLELVAELQPATVLDYGCGQGSLGRTLAANGVRVAEYDPAIAGKAAMPVPAELVVCTDVLEHIEEDRIAAVLDHLQALTLGRLLAVISTVPAMKVLPDGRNAHVLIRPDEWWLEQLSARFDPDWRPVACRAHKELAAVWSRRA